jgi:hypothetical protein
MAWAWPEIPLVGDALEHYRTDALAQQARSTARLVGICLLTAASGAATYEALFGTSNRFELLEGELRDVVDHLSTLVREGLLIRQMARGEDQEWNLVVRKDLNLDLLFGELEATHGKKSVGGLGEPYEEGDPVTITLFDLGGEEEEEEEEWVEVEGAGDEGYIKMTAQQKFLYQLGESKLNEVLVSIEQALPLKKKNYAGRGGGSGRRGSGKTKLSKAGREAAVMLKEILPKVRLNELKLMLAVIKPEAEAPAVLNKEDLILAIIGCVLPNYPIPQGDGHHPGEAEA